MSVEDIDRALLEAHAADDRPELVALYRQAGDMMLAAGRVGAGCFYLTHAYIFALDCGAPEAAAIHQTLVAYGREE
jgi:hypothetical protein